MDFNDKACTLRAYEIHACYIKWSHEQQNEKQFLSAWLGFPTGLGEDEKVNSKEGKKFSSLLPGQIILGTMDGFNKVCDAAEVAGWNVMSTSISCDHRTCFTYGEQAAQVTNEGLDTAGHAIGTSWAMFKLMKTLNLKSVIKPTKLAKAAAEANSAKLKPKKK
ncbi:Senescence/spartin-associated protein [Spatholobus suberectus]|nr:Senescence/spartin-associated protein [Spatholobus suberectus]